MTHPCNDVPDVLAAMAPHSCPSCCYISGAAVAFGIVGMAQAIRRTHLGYRDVRFTMSNAPPIMFHDFDPDDDPCSDSPRSK